MRQNLFSEKNNSSKAKTASLSMALMSVLISMMLLSGAVFAVSSIQVTSPNGGNIWGGIHDITWTSDCIAGENINIFLVKESPASSSAIVLGANCSTKSYAWDTHGRSDGSDYKIRIESSTYPTGIYDYSNVFFTIDNTAPTTTASLTGNPGNNDWYTSDVVVALSASDTTSGVNETKYKINNGAEQTYSSAFTISDDGIYTVAYYSVDLAGNVETTNTITVKVDKTAPVITIVGDNPTVIAYGDTYTDNGATAYDNMSGDITANIVTYSNVSTAILGTYQVTYDVTDNAGHAAIQKIRDVEVVRRPITVTAVTDTKIYDGGITSSKVPTITSGSLAFDDNATWTQTFDIESVGDTKILTPDGVVVDGNSGNNYDVNFVDTTGVITAASLTVSGITADNKEYDGNTDAVLTGSAALEDVVVGDNVTLNTSAATGSFDNKNAGTGKTVYVSGLTISGVDADNYILIQPETTANITERAITVTAVHDEKIYDGTTASSEVPTMTGSLATGDTATWTQTFDNKSVGIEKTLMPNGIVNDGNSGNNYAVNLVNDNTGIINAASVSVTANADDKVYDGNTDAVASLSVDGVISPDVVTASGTASFADKNVGDGKTVSVESIALGGADADNYVLASTTSSTTADITKKAASVTPNAASKTYGESDPALTGTLVNFLPADGVTATYSRVAGEYVGSYTISATLSPTDVLDNYEITYNTATFTINTRPITVTADDQTKVYGEPDPTTLTYTITSGSLVGGDLIDGALTRNSGEGVGTYAITQGTLTAGSNYSMTYVGNNLVISQANLTVTAVDQTITYGAAEPTFTFAYSGFKNDENYSIIDTPPTCTVSDVHTNAGTYTIVCSGGADDNYAFDYVDGTLTVNKATPTISVTGGVFEYDGNEHPATGSVTGVLGEDLGTPTLKYNGSADAPVERGTYEVDAYFAGNENYDEATDNSASIVIQDTTAPTIISYTLSRNMISPLAETNNEVSIDLEFSETVTYDLRILDSAGNTVFKYPVGTDQNPTPKIWDGTYDGSFVPGGVVYNISVAITDVAGNTYLDKSRTITVYDLILNLDLDWNLVSVPTVVDRTDVSEVFSGATVWEYNGTGWGNPATLVAGKGYWVSTHEDEGLNYVKSSGFSNPPSYVPELDGGWNLIGFTSKDPISIQTAMEDVEVMGEEYKAYKYLGRSPDGEDVWSTYSSLYGGTNFTVNAGEGYWVLVSEAYASAP